MDKIRSGELASRFLYIIPQLPSIRNNKIHNTGLVRCFYYMAACARRSITITASVCWETKPFP